MAGERILVVDDNPVNVKLARIVLEDEGYVVAAAGDATAALAAVASFQPRLILMDMRLPGASGLDVTRALRARPDTAGLVIVALTACAMKGDEQQALAAGCDGYLTKPIDVAAFPAQIARYLALR